MLLLAMMLFSGFNSRSKVEFKRINQTKHRSQSCGQSAMDASAVAAATLAGHAGLTKQPDSAQSKGNKAILVQVSHMLILRLFLIGLSLFSMEGEKRTLFKRFQFWKDSDLKN